jgi:hypothetical protein
MWRGKWIRLCSWTSPSKGSLCFGTCRQRAFCFYGVFNHAVQYTKLVGWKTNWKGFGRKWSWSDRTTAPVSAWKDWGKHERTCVNRDSNQSHLKYDVQSVTATQKSRYQSFGGTYCFHLQYEK